MIGCFDMLKLSSLSSSWDDDRHHCCQDHCYHHHSGDQSGQESYLHDDRDPRGQGLSLEHVQLASLSLAVKDAGDEDGEEQHGDDDQARHDEGEEVLLVR